MKTIIFKNVLEQIEKEEEKVTLNQEKIIEECFGVNSGLK